MLYASYLDVLLQFCLAGANHTDAALPFQLTPLVVVGHARGHARSTCGGALAPFSGLNNAVVPCTLRLDSLRGQLSVC